MMFLKIFKVVEVIAELITDLIKFRERKKSEEELKKLKSQLKTVSDSSRSMEERAKALCEIEKRINSDSDCDGM